MTENSPSPRRRRDVVAQKSQETRRAQEKQQSRGCFLKFLLSVLILGGIAGGGYYFGFVFKDGAYGTQVRSWVTDQLDDTTNDDSNTTTELTETQPIETPPIETPPITITEKIVEILAPKDTLYRVLSKEMKPGELIDKTIQSGQKSKDFTEWTDPTFYLVCETDVTHKTVKYSVPEKVYNNTFVNDSFPIESTGSWKLVNEKR